MRQIQDKETDKVRFTVSIPKDMEQEFELYCRRFRRSKSFQVFLLIEELLKKQKQADRE